MAGGVPRSHDRAYGDGAKRKSAMTKRWSLRAAIAVLQRTGVKWWVVWMRSMRRIGNRRW